MRRGGFHATERSWFIGAKDSPGEVFITEPYLDADDGQMCFSVSTLLADGETVVGMDLNFSKAQESIMEMTQGPDYHMGLRRHHTGLHRYHAGLRKSHMVLRESHMVLRKETKENES